MRKGPQKYGYNVESCQNACKEYKYFSSNTTAGAPARTTRPTRPSTAHPRATAYGGGWCNYIYKNIDVTAKNTPIGPFKDTGSRAFRHGPKAYKATTSGIAQKACKDYKYFALQHNGWCSCENDLQHATKYRTVVVWVLRWRVVQLRLS